MGSRQRPILHFAKNISLLGNYIDFLELRFSEIKTEKSFNSKGCAINDKFYRYLIILCMLVLKIVPYSVTEMDLKIVP